MQPARREQHARVRWMVDENARFVARTLRKQGVPWSDLDDEVQRTFIVAADRLEDLQAGSERSFLFQVALNVAAHARRRLARRREKLEASPPERIEAIATPEFLVDRKQLGKVLDEVVGSLSERLRETFTLYELESMSLVEISRLLRVPRGTIASRLRRARAQLRSHLAAIEHGIELRVDGDEIAELPLLRRERASALQKAMLAAGMSLRPSGDVRAKTLAALGESCLQIRPRRQLPACRIALYPSGDVHLHRLASPRRPS